MDTSDLDGTGIHAAAANADDLRLGLMMYECLLPCFQRQYTECARKVRVLGSPTGGNPPPPQEKEHDNEAEADADTPGADEFPHWHSRALHWETMWCRAVRALMSLCVGGVASLPEDDDTVDFKLDHSSSTKQVPHAMASTQWRVGGHVFAARLLACTWPTVCTQLPTAKKVSFPRLEQCPTLLLPQPATETVPSVAELCKDFFRGAREAYGRPLRNVGGAVTVESTNAPLDGFFEWRVMREAYDHLTSLETSIDLDVIDDEVRNDARALGLYRFEALCTKMAQVHFMPSANKHYSIVPWILQRGMKEIQRDTSKHDGLFLGLAQYALRLKTTDARVLYGVFSQPEGLDRLRECAHKRGFYEALRRAAHVEAPAPSEGQPTTNMGDDVFVASLTNADTPTTYTPTQQREVEEEEETSLTLVNTVAKPSQRQDTHNPSQTYATHSDSTQNEEFVSSVNSSSHNGRNHHARRMDDPSNDLDWNLDDNGAGVPDAESNSVHQEVSIVLLGDEGSSELFVESQLWG